MTSRQRNQGISQTKPGEPSVFEELFKERARERREAIKATQYDAEFKKKTAKAEKIMKRYRKTLRSLAR